MTLVLIGCLAALIAFGLAHGFREASISAHAWRGVAMKSDLFNHFLVLGFVTGRLSKHRLEDRIRELNEMLVKMKGPTDGAV